jgi:hypothetical protein
MSHVPHLVEHTLRTHRMILLAWLATVIALPLLASVRWSPQMGAGVGVGAAIALQGARLLLGMATVASIVQADSPIDDRAFWRTRPIASRTLAIAHLVTVGCIFVVVPTLVVLGIAMVFGVPRSHWLTTMLQVAAAESAIAGLSLVIASRTRGIPTFLIAAVTGLIAFYLLVGAMYELRRLLEWQGHVQMADPFRGVWASLGIAAFLLPPLFVVAMAGPRRRTAFLAGVLGVLILATSVWFLPALRFVPPPPVEPSLSFTESSMRVEPVPDAPGAVALVLAVRPAQPHPRDEWRFWLKRGELSTAKGVRVLVGSPAGHVPRIKHSEVSLAIGVLSADEFKALAGTRVRLEGSVQGDVERHVTEATARLAAGASLETDHQRLSIERVLDGTPNPDRRMRPVVDGTEIYLSSPGLSFRHGHAYLLRNRDSGCEVNVYAWPSPALRLTQVAMLPTLARPFTVMRVELAERVPATCRVDPANAEVEMRTIETRSAGTHPVSLEFTLPATVPTS